ncbi:DUF2993 domain-containing protein [Streptomyces sp. NPDC004647]|uniref:LmeA family phospholipid-binding protein n=1 Tax=Streptomyces sp. NPDC004647 TaxID=3154671 RepID=UPI0033BBCADD
MRGVRILLIVAVVLGGLFVAADRLAVGLAESKAAEKIQSSQGLSTAPEVSIKGFPFLTQVAGKQLDEVDMSLDGVTAGTGERTIRLTEMTAELHDVKLENNLSSATAARATGTARISYQDLSKAASEGVSVGYGGQDKAGKGQVKVTGRVALPVLGKTFERSVVSTVAIAGGDTIRLRADAIPGAQLPGLERVVREKIDFDREISGLPEGLKLDKVEATANGVEISVVGTQVKLG